MGGLKVQHQMAQLAMQAVDLSAREAEMEKREAELERQHEELQADIATFERRREEETRIVNLAMLGQRIDLNVGGSRFSTTRQTLTSCGGSILEGMFSGRHTIVTQEDGSYFIDRDGQHFSYILNFLRDRNPKSLPKDVAVRQQLRVECGFYGLPPLLQALVSTDTESQFRRQCGPTLGTWR